MAGHRYHHEVLVPVGSIKDSPDFMDSELERWLRLNAPRFHWSRQRLSGAYWIGFLQEEDKDKAAFVKLRWG